MSQEIVQIKPVVLFGIGEHYKRKTIQLKSKDFLIMGCLYGIRDGLTLNINFSTPIRVTEDQKQNKIEKSSFVDYLTQSDKLVRIDHNGNNLRNLELVGLYLLRKDSQLAKQDEDLFTWLGELGFENQRLLLANFEKEHKIQVFKREQNRVVEVPFTNATESSETICIKGLSENSKVSPYLKTLETNRNLILNYNTKLQTLKKRLLVETDLQKLRQLSSLINNLGQLTEDKTILEELNSAVVFNFSVALNLEKKHVF